MLTQAQNETLTRIGPGTPMGAVLRQHWLPIAAVSEMDDRSVKPVRLLGENLVLYKDRSGTFGLIDRHCPHRRADMAFGFVEDCGLRCNYHGWLFDADGRCIERPYEDVALGKAQVRDKVRTTAYPVRAIAGLLWAFLGTGEPPLLPNYEAFSWTNGFKQIVISEVPCNWAQCQENSIDPVHFEWMHSNWSLRLKGQDGPYAPRHVKIGFEEFEHGFLYKRVREDTDEQHDLWTVGRVTLWPIGVYLGDHFEWRVPIDDENTLSIAWSFQRVPVESEPYEQTSIPHWYGPTRDAKGEWISSHVMNQDFIAWVGQGTIADRTREHLGRSDLGVGLMRRQLFADIEAVAEGRDPKGVVRTPPEGGVIRLPTSHYDRYVRGLPRAELLAHPVLGRHLRGYPYQAGQPREVQEALWEAMGVSRAQLGLAAARPAEAMA